MYPCSTEDLPGLALDRTHIRSDRAVVRVKWDFFGELSECGTRAIRRRQTRYWHPILSAAFRVARRGFDAPTNASSRSQVLRPP